MQVGIKDGGDGVRCWNRDAIAAYADRVNSRERQISSDNPDVTVLPGRLVCYGCEVMEYDYGVKCTASLTRTRYAVSGEIEPRPEDAKGSLLDVTGLLGRAPAEVEATATTPSPAAAASASGASPVDAATAGSNGAPTPRTDSKRGGLRGLFGR